MKITELLLLKVYKFSLISGFNINANVLNWIRTNDAKSVCHDFICISCNIL